MEAVPSSTSQPVSEYYVPSTAVDADQPLHYSLSSKFHTVPKAVGDRKVYLTPEFDAQHDKILFRYEHNYHHRIPKIDDALKKLSARGEISRKELERALYTDGSLWDLFVPISIELIGGESVDQFTGTHLITHSIYSMLLFNTERVADVYARAGAALQELDPEGKMHVPLLTLYPHAVSSPKLPSGKYMLVQKGPHTRGFWRTRAGNMKHFASGMADFLEQVMEVGSLNTRTTIDDLVYHEKTRSVRLFNLTAFWFRKRAHSMVPTRLQEQIVDLLKDTYDKAAASSTDAQTYFRQLEAVLETGDFARLVRAASLVPEAPWTARTIADLIKGAELGGRRRRRW